MKCSNTFNVQRGVRQGCPLSPILFNLFINDIFQGCKKYGVKCGESYCCGDLFADDIVLCAPTKKKLFKLLKKVSKWTTRNLITFGINKCATMVIRPKNSTGHHTDPVFKINNVPIPQTDCYIYLGIPFNNKLSLKPVVSLLRQKIRKALFSNKGFFKNSNIPLFFKKTLFNSALIGRISYYAPLLGSNKSRSKSIQSLINVVFYWIAGFNNPNSLISLYSISKELNVQSPKYVAIINGKTLSVLLVTLSIISLRCSTIILGLKNLNLLRVDFLERNLKMMKKLKTFTGRMICSKTRPKQKSIKNTILIQLDPIFIGL